VIREYERCLALPVDAAAPGAVVIEAAAAPVAPAARPRRSPPAWWWLAAAATAGLAVLVLLPDPAPAPVQPAHQREAARPSVADAVVPEPAAPTAGVMQEVQPAPADAAADVEAAPTPPAQAATPEEELRKGDRALADFRPAEARAAYQRALTMDAASEAAKAGLAAAARQSDLLAGMGEGARAEAQGDLEEALAQYRLLLANQPDFAPARVALDRVQARVQGVALEQHLVSGAQALRQGRIAEAEAAYAKAAAISARDPRLLDGQQRLAEIHRNQQNERDLAQGVGLEAAERWSEAVAHYERALERETGLRFAEDGLARSQRRAALDDELESYRAAPERLTAPAVRQAAQRALARGSATDADSPRLQAQLAWLRDTLATLAEPVRVELTSDNSTHVSVLPVGELGSFQRRALELPPGQYTVIGRRDGFRDVRHELNLAPGQRGTTLSVRCTEPI
jgi:tetratricopeptide (TPR) repeat protein